MANPVIGVGYLIANDLLSDVAFKLFEPVVSLSFPAAIGSGSQTIAIWSSAIYVGALLVVGVIGGDAEVVTVTAVVTGTSFTAVFANGHASGEPIGGATFPVQSLAGDAFFTQNEMLNYLSDAYTDFLVRVPLAYSISTAVTVGPSQPIAALPADFMQPSRVAAFGRALRETSQSNLDSYDYQWNVQAAAEPRAFYRDKIGLQKIGVWPRADNNTNLEIIYEQRGPELFGLADGFSLPDPFLVIVKHKVLAMAYSKDGEQRSPAMAKFWEQRYEAGVKIASVLLQVVQDQSQQ